MNDDDSNDFFDDDVCDQIQKCADDIIKQNSIITIDDSNEEPQPEHIQLLQSKFKHKKFRSKQWEIIRALIIEKRDVVGVMATGYGKSLCFQFPAMFLNGITLVVSPLIALMEDQILNMTQQGIPACLLGSAQQDREIPSRIVAGDFKLIYASPEYLNRPNGKALLEKIRGRVKLIAIDEAHCVCQWGFDFRPDYRRLGNIRDAMPSVPILALTATAVEKSRQDIANVLNLRRPKFIVSSFDRSNLEFIIRHKRSRWKDIGPYLENTDGSTIIYVLKREDAEQLSALLQTHKIKCVHYHAGIPMEERKKISLQFKNDEIRVLVATIAFGMGIDKRDVRTVIHYGASSTMEKYYQEVGRAGRDGRPSLAITFYSTDDFDIHDHFLRLAKVGVGIKTQMTTMHNEMRAFLYSPRCRRAQILEYFGEDPRSIAPRPNCCDNCTSGLNAWRLSDLYDGLSDEGTFDFGPLARTLMTIVQNKSEMEKFAVIRRAKSMSKQNPFGIAADLSEKPYFWEAIIEQLRITGLLDMNYVPMDDEKDSAMLSITEYGRDWFAASNTNQKLKLKAIGLMYAFFRRKDIASTDGGLAAIRSFKFHCDDAKLKVFLCEVRNILAEHYNVMPFQVIRDDMIDQMIRYKPKNMDEFKMHRYDGFNTERLENYASTLVNAFNKYKAGELDMGLRLVIDSMPHVRQYAPPHLLGKIQSGENVMDIAEEFHITTEHAVKHCVELLKRGKCITLMNLKTFCAVPTTCDPADVLDHLTKDDLCAITPSNAVDPVITRLQSACPHLTRIFIECVLTYYQVREHLKSKNVPFVDVVNDTLVNGKYLIPAKPPKRKADSVDSIRKVRRYDPKMEIIDWDTFFGNRVPDPVELMFGGSSDDDTDDTDDEFSSEDDDD